MKCQRLYPATLFRICVLIGLLPVYPKAQATRNDDRTQLYGIFNNPATKETRIMAIYPGSMHPGAETHNCFQEGSTIAETSSLNWQGSATLAYDRRTGRFFYAGRFGSRASVWAQDSRGAHERISEGNREWIGHGISKMATGPDGNVYALTTPMRDSHANGKSRTILVRIHSTTAGQKPKLETIGYLSGKGGYRNAMAYSGDMAFAANGDLYIFGTEIDTVLQYYMGAHIFRIEGSSLKQRDKSSSIHVENLGRISGMGHVAGYDSTVINGVAFFPDGTFILSAVDKVTQSRTCFFQGRVQPGSTHVHRLDPPLTVPSGFIIGDLASGAFPPIKPVRPLTPPMVQRSDTPPADDWEKSVTIRTFHY